MDYTNSSSTWTAAQAPEALPAASVRSDSEAKTRAIVPDSNPNGVFVWVDFIVPLEQEDCHLITGLSKPVQKLFL